MSPLPSRPDLKAACALLEAGSARGTGFLVSADRLLTCNHVVRGAGEGPILATFSHGQYEAKVELVDAENDCALLRLLCPVPTADAQPLTLATVPVLRSAVAPNPYRGLASFQPEDAPVFLGRERLTLAGLLPALQARPVQGRQSMRFVICKPGDRSVESLARALVAHLPPDCEVLPSSRQIAIEKLLRDADAQGVTAATLR